MTKRHYARLGHLPELRHLHFINLAAKCFGCLGLITLAIRQPLAFSAFDGKWNYGDSAFNALVGDRWQLSALCADHRLIARRA